MFLVNKENKTTQKIEDISFKSCGLSERNDLQEWITKNPIILGEELLIIQKEFDGFSDTNERLDLLAVDKNGNLVVIENKLDDSGKDVVWQALKYAGYCSSLKKEDIRTIYQQYLTKNNIPGNAEEMLTEFLNKADFSEVQLNQDLTQRVILVAREFRKEVTNTVIWARKYGMKIQCIKVIPYMIGEQLIVDTDQIIPVKDIADIMISYDEKAHDDLKNKEDLANSEIIRNEFWHLFLPKFNEKSKLFSGRNLDLNHYSHWLSTGSGISGVVFSFVVTKTYAGIEFTISKSKDSAENKKIFDYFYSHKKDIDHSFGGELNWERLDEKVGSRISISLYDVSILNRDDWDKIMDFLTDNMIRMEKALRKYIDSYSRR
ncbi:MAG: DUF4268 domain-containing protein [Bacilli bacterium]|nr:DUF4268 domain-containing protein [Bacilli bacterium]